MSAAAERALLLGVPFAALATVGLGLRWGAPDVQRTAIVRAARDSRAHLGLAWQVSAFEDVQGDRSPLVGVDLDVSASSAEGSAHWTGKTNADGIAEMTLALSEPTAVTIEIRQREGSVVLARGRTAAPPDLPRPASDPVWMPFSRRTGPIALDVAVLGQRVAPGLPASIWVRAEDARTGDPLAGVLVSPGDDPSLTFARAADATQNGWAELVAVPVGLAVSLELRARRAGGATGQWQGGLTSSPGAVAIETRPRWDPTDQPVVELTAFVAKTPEYVEIDDDLGRAWATSVDVAGDPGRTRVTLPRLPQGLYWIVASPDANGATELGPGTATRPFFVAPSDAAALALVADPRACGEGEATLLPCLALQGARAMPRWTAMDGRTAVRAERQRRRTRGVAVATSSLLLAMALESVLVLRAVAKRRAPELDGGAAPLAERAHAWGRITVGLLVALLGFALLTAFVLRAE
jgi:hypothetical protein